MLIISENNLFVDEQCILKDTPNINAEKKLLFHITFSQLRKNNPVVRGKEIILIFPLLNSTGCQLFKKK